MYFLESGISSRYKNAKDIVSESSYGPSERTWVSTLTPPAATTSDGSRITSACRRLVKSHVMIVRQGVNDLRISAKVSMDMPRSLSSCCSAHAMMPRTMPLDISLTPPGTSINARTNFRACSRSTLARESLINELDRLLASRALES